VKGTFHLSGYCLLIAPKNTLHLCHYGLNIVKTVQNAIKTARTVKIREYMNTYITGVKIRV